MADQDLVSGLSKLVGYSIVLPAFFVLIPQILKVSIMWPTYMIENSTFLDLLFSKAFLELDISARYGRQAAEKA